MEKPLVSASSHACDHICFASSARWLRKFCEVSVMAALISSFLACWALGYVLGFKVRMIRNALNAA